MVLGALVDAGLPVEDLSRGLAALRLDGWRLSARKVQRGFIEATRLEVILGDGSSSGSKSPAHQHGEKPPPHEHHEHHGTALRGDQVHQGDGHGADRHSHGGLVDHGHPRSHEPHRHLRDILGMIDGSDLPLRVKERSGEVFRRLAAAEARIHGRPIEEVHFHEVGAVDSIVDIVGSVLGLHLLGVEALWCSPATVGTGFVHGSHGEIPLPAPATMELLRGFPVTQRMTGHELTTPTGAALSTTLAKGFGPLPAMTVSAVGYGAGDDRPAQIPNVLRIILGDRAPAAVPAGAPGAPGAAAPAAGDRVVCLETSVDDASPQWIGHLIDRLLEAGALDVSVTPIVMKKSRPAHDLRVLAAPGTEGPLVELLFRETTTLGIRRSEMDRIVLERSFETVPTPWGAVRIKLGRRSGEILSAAAEYEDLHRIATENGIPLREVQRRAIEEYHRRQAAPRRAQNLSKDCPGSELL